MSTPIEITHCLSAHLVLLLFDHLIRDGFFDVLYAASPNRQQKWRSSHKQSQVLHADQGVANGPRIPLHCGRQTEVSSRCFDKRQFWNPGYRLQTQHRQRCTRMHRPVGIFCVWTTYFTQALCSLTKPCFIVCFRLRIPRLARTTQDSHTEHTEEP